MIRARIIALTMLASAALPACGPADNAPGPGGVTVGEAKALDEAAEIIEARRAPPGADPDAATDTVTIEDSRDE